MKRSLKSVFNQKSFDKTFMRQLDDMSCVPACFTTVARIYGLDRKKDYKFFRKELKTNAGGTSVFNTMAACKKHLPVTKSGLNCYQKGVAIGFICHKPTGSDHAVVFLARKGGTVIYYDPYDHRIYRDQVRNMRRSSSPDNSYKTWTANFAEIEGADFTFWKRLSVQNPFSLEKQIFRTRQKKRAPGK